MRSTIEFIRAGYVLEQTVALPRGGPWNNERTPAPAESEADFSNQYIRTDCVDLSYAQQPEARFRAESVKAALSARQQGEEVLLTSDDYVDSPRVYTFASDIGPLEFEKGTGYPYRMPAYQTCASQTLDEFVRNLSRIPTATWAIAPAGPQQTPPRLLIFVPLADAVRDIPDGGNELLFGDERRAHSNASSDLSTVRVDESAVYIGSVRVDRRTSPTDVAPVSH